MTLHLIQEYWSGLALVQDIGSEISANILNIFRRKNYGC
jgi:3D (Asp-Asp-Asp) domain-containing protein